LDLGLDQLTSRRPVAGNVGDRVHFVAIGVVIEEIEGRGGQLGQAAFVVPFDVKSPTTLALTIFWYLRVELLESK